MNGSSSDCIEDELDALFEAIVEAVRSEDRSLAMQLAVEAVDKGLDEPLVLLLAAEAAAERGDLNLAAQQLGMAAAVAPDQAEVWRRLGGVCVAMGEIDCARDAFSRALKLEPDSGGILLAAANVDYRGGDLALAEARFERAAALLPASSEPLEGLAAIAARRRDAPRARELALRALGAAGATVGAHLTLCRADLLDGEAAAARARVEQVLSRPDLAADRRIAALDVRAEARDALDDIEGAFADYTLRNRLIGEGVRNNGAVQGEVVRRAVRIADVLAATPPACWRASPDVDSADDLGPLAHVFLMGFPRSGTTLLEKVLASHPDVTTLEEVDHLGTVSGDLLRDRADLAALADMTPTEAARRRLDYWTSVRRTLEMDVSSRVVVDKLPLHTLALPVIAKLFPNAKVLFALRDPRDVVFSCFRRRFVLNAAMAEFLEIDRAAAFYDAVMALARQARAVLTLRLLEVRMETLIQDFDREAARVLQFLDLGWDDRVRAFTARIGDTARTPSDLQLLRGLNSDGVGQWRRYAGPLEPVLPTLQPWVNRFGYS